MLINNTCFITDMYSHHHHHKHQGLDSLIRYISRVTAALSNASSVFQLFSFLVVCSGMISKGYLYIYIYIYIYSNV
jgi:hypothetical protein